jgi:hypothetical protein
MAYYNSHQTAMISPNTDTEGPALPRSVRWRLQMGLLDLPTRGSNRSLCAQYRQSTVRFHQQEKYLKLVTRHEPDYIELTHELEMPAVCTPTDVADAVSPEKDPIDPLTAAAKQLTATEEKDQATIRTAKLRHSMEHAARHRRRTCIVTNNQQLVRGDSNSRDSST